MQREFSINLLLLIAINLMIKPFFIFGIDRTVQNVVGTETYGIYFTLLSFTYLLQIINDFGLQNFNSREISQHRQLLPKYLPNVLVVKMLLALVFLLAVFGLGWLAGYLVHFKMLLFLAFNQILVSLLFYFRSNLSGLGYYRADSLISALDKLLMIIFCSLLLWVAPFSESFQIEWFVYAQTLSLLLTLVLAGLLVNSRMQAIRMKANPAIIRMILRKSFPFALVILLMTLYTRIDVIMIEKLLPDGEYQAGVYGAAYRLLDASNMIGFLFATLLMPMFSRLLKTGGDLKSLVVLSFRLIFSGSVLLSVAVFFYKVEIMEWLYTEANQEFGGVLGWLMLSFIAVSGTYIFGTLLTANGSMRKMNQLFLWGILANVLLNAFLIPKFQANGAALATLFTQWAVFLGQVWLAIRLIRLNLEISLLVQSLSFLAFCFLAGWVVKSYLDLSWGIGFIFCVSIYLLAAILLKMLNFKALYQLIGHK